MPKFSLIVFNVNETLLYLETMAPVFDCIFGKDRPYAVLVRQLGYGLRSSDGR